MALHFKTILARTPDALLSHLSSLHIPGFLLFTLSTNLPGHHLSSAVSRLTSLSPNSIGCLTAPLNFPSEDSIACSLALFKSENCVPFRSITSGSSTPRVGRWHAPPERSDADITPFLTENGVKDLREMWGRRLDADVLPETLRTLKPDDVTNIVYFSDASPVEFSNSLMAFPWATKVGLVASSTPFITGRPVTLFYNDKIYSSGAVGIALTGTDTRSSSCIHFPKLRALTEQMTITRCEGNLISELDAGNPAQLLLRAIEKNNIGREQPAFDGHDQFYLGVLQDDELAQVYRVSSGDPSRGIIALDAHVAPRQGTRVKFYFHGGPTTIPPVNRVGPTSTGTRVLNFLASPPQTRGDSQGEDQVRLLSDVFVGASENGFVVGRGASGEVPWRCTAPGGVASLGWT